MGNNEIGMRKQNYDNRTAAQKALDILKAKQFRMDRMLEEVIVNGKKTIREVFTPKPE